MQLKFQRSFFFKGEEVNPTREAEKRPILENVSRKDCIAYYRRGLKAKQDKTSESQEKVPGSWTRYRECRKHLGFLNVLGIVGRRKSEELVELEEMLGVNIRTNMLYKKCTCLHAHTHIHA